MQQFAIAWQQQLSLSTFKVTLKQLITATMMCYKILELFEKVAFDQLLLHKELKQADHN